MCGRALIRIGDFLDELEREQEAEKNQLQAAA
jgi:hypothetical protein